MIFHTLHGLPPVFDGIKSAIRTQRDLTFNEVISILKAEENEIQSKEEKGASSVFLATQKFQDLKISEGGASSSNTWSQSAPMGQQYSAYQLPQYQTHTQNHQTQSQTQPQTLFSQPQTQSQQPTFSQNTQSYNTQYPNFTPQNTQHLNQATNQSDMAAVELLCDDCSNSFTGMLSLP